MTTFTLQDESSAPSYTDQTRNTTSFTLQTRDTGSSLLLKEDGDSLLLEDGGGIVLEQSVIGDVWVTQPKT